jgi:demethylmenaquinone methyltransferase/2-methoxy-6-polyprenyl-1,4-benzoquinol methylase
LCLREAYRVLKSGGRFFCLEFSTVENEILNLLYQKYSKLIPLLGKIIVGNKEPYDYLISSIDKFYNQSELVDLLKKNKFSNVEFRNLSNGISAIHSGWKI